MLIFLFFLSMTGLVFFLVKLKLNAFLALLITAYGTGILCQIPLSETVEIVTAQFGSTIGSIGIVTGLGIMLGRLLYESGGIDAISQCMLKKFGEHRAPYAITLSGFVAGIPIFGDVVYMMLAPILRDLSRRTGASIVSYVCAISVATTCTFALVLPTAPPFTVAENIGVSLGAFFCYALVAALVGSLAGGIFYSNIINKADCQKHIRNFSHLKSPGFSTFSTARPHMRASTALSILLAPMGLILCGSFAPLLLSPGTFLDLISFLGSKNIAMTVGVLYAALASRPYITQPVTEIMTSAAEKAGFILLITGAGGAYGGILQASGIAQAIAALFASFHIPILILCFLISQTLRCALGSTTVALTMACTIMTSSIHESGVSPILCAIAICAGGIGLSLPNDSGFWTISRLFHLSLVDTFRSWTMGGFVAGISILIFVSILSLFQNVLPGL